MGFGRKETGRGWGGNDPNMSATGQYCEMNGKTLCDGYAQANLWKRKRLSRRQSTAAQDCMEAEHSGLCTADTLELWSLDDVS